MRCRFRIRLVRSEVALTSRRSVVVWRRSSCSWLHRTGARTQTPTTATIPKVKVKKVKVKNPLAATRHSLDLQTRGVDGDSDRRTETATEGGDSCETLLSNRSNILEHSAISFLMFHTRSALAVEYFQFHFTV